MRDVQPDDAPVPITVMDEASFTKGRDRPSGGLSSARRLDVFCLQDGESRDFMFLDRFSGEEQA
ncbi:hypothetical protein NBH19_15365 [Rhizobium sp. S95]|uniref:Uncharacterized protein n=1 Tax=Ciceribacter sichuanensis TaxID=2949647 RepID=A0AAJ1F8M8_9HYPH|nr:MULTISPECIES: hypothetical protein [unclassified Ciceribacter]MCM2397454.1 hypothetical protein [Ciceribacter sp. S95]MCO5959152.1 hypothetical protein [Ciceribacter sp. S101]